MKLYLDRIVVSCYTHFYAPIDEGQYRYGVPRLRRGEEDEWMKQKGKDAKHE